MGLPSLLSLRLPPSPSKTEHQKQNAGALSLVSPSLSPEGLAEGRAISTPPCPQPHVVLFGSPVLLSPVWGSAAPRAFC